MNTKSKNYTLLIWETFPENVDVFLIPNDDIDEIIRYHLEKSHQKIINCHDDIASTEIISDILATNIEYCRDTTPDQYKGLFGNKYLVSKDAPPIIKPITHVYYTGFCL